MANQNYQEGPIAVFPKLLDTTLDVSSTSNATVNGGLLSLGRYNPFLGGICVDITFTGSGYVILKTPVGFRVSNAWICVVTAPGTTTNIAVNNGSTAVTGNMATGTAAGAKVTTASIDPTVHAFAAGDDDFKIVGGAACRVIISIVVESDYCGNIT